MSLFEGDEAGAMVATLNGTVDVDEALFEDIFKKASVEDIAYMERIYWRLRRENGGSDNFKSFEWTTTRVAYFRGRQDLWNIFRMIAKEQGYLQDTKAEYADFMIDTSEEMDQLLDEDIYILSEARHQIYLQAKALYIQTIGSAGIELASIYYFITTEAVARLSGNRFLAPKLLQMEAKLIEQAAKGDIALTRASIFEKLTQYLLNPNHPAGKSKAKWFKEALGFTAENADDLGKQIVFDPTKAVITTATQYGTKYNQVIPITGANGRIIQVTFAWIKNNDGVIRLVTAIPTKL